MSVTICGVYEVPQFSNTPLDHIVSIHEAGFEAGTGFQPGPDITQFRYPFTLHSFTFRDVGQPHEAEAPTEAIIRRLLKTFTHMSAKEHVLFHCFAGRSRSTAAAFLWFHHLGASYDQAYDNIVAIRGPGIKPNPLMIRLADQILGLNGAMLEAVCRRSNDMGYLTTP